MSPSVKKADHGEFENVGCYYSATVLLVHSSPTTEQIRGKYRLNDHTVLVAAGADRFFFGLDKPKDMTGQVRQDIRALPLEKLLAPANNLPTSDLIIRGAIGAGGKDALKQELERFSMHKT